MVKMVVQARGPKFRIQRGRRELILFFFGFSRQGFSVALEPVLELALIDQAGLKLTEICLSLPPDGWD